MTIRRNYLKRRIGKMKRKDFTVKNVNILGSRKSRFQLPVLTLPMPQRKKRRGVMLVRLYVSTAIKKATLPVTISGQKTTIGLGNFCAGN